MKFHKKTVAANAKMELVVERVSSNSRISKSFKRSKSFRASSRIISKIRNQTNLRDNEESVDPKLSANQFDLVMQSKSTNDRLKSVNLTDKIYTDNGTKEITDLRGIVKDVKNKLTITMRAKRKNRPNENTTISLEPRTTFNKINESNNCTRRERASTFSNTINEFHSYENPTFDCSFDNSVSGCLYKDDPNFVDDFENARTEKIINAQETVENPSITNNSLKKVVTILVGNDEELFVSKLNDPLTSKPETTTKNLDNLSSNARCRQAFMKNDKNSRDKLLATKTTSSTSSWLTSRGSSFRFKSNYGYTVESAGLLAGGATSVTST